MLIFVKDKSIPDNFYQCGFRKNNSTEFAALSFAETIWTNIDQGRLTGAVFTGLRKAFDTIRHDLLLDKLSNLGVIDRELKWFKDYLRDCTQVMEFQGVWSDSEGVAVGVPQGSILGPLLFILHINDLPDSAVQLSALIYADDWVLFTTKQASVIEDKLNGDLASIGRWPLRIVYFLS